MSRVLFQAAGGYFGSNFDGTRNGRIFPRIFGKSCSKMWSRFNQDAGFDRKIVECSKISRFLYNFPLQEGVRFVNGIYFYIFLRREPPKTILNQKGIKNIHVVLFLFYLKVCPPWLNDHINFEFLCNGYPHHIVMNVTISRKWLLPSH